MGQVVACTGGGRLLGKFLGWRERKKVPVMDELAGKLHRKQRNKGKTVKR